MCKIGVMPTKYKNKLRINAITLQTSVPPFPDANRISLSLGRLWEDVFSSTRTEFWCVIGNLIIWILYGVCHAAQTMF